MTTLSDIQRLILEAAAQHPSGITAPPAHLPPAPRAAVAKAMLKAGMLAAAEEADPIDPALAWRLDGQALVLRITDAGRLQAIGAAGPSDTAQDAVEAPGAGAAATRVAVAAVQDVPAVPRRPVLRDAARVLLAAWDAPERPGLSDTIEALRTALAPARVGQGRQPRPLGSPRAPRVGTKQQQVLALLRRPEGASGPDIIATTGWAPHTVRGFLAGLKRRGIVVSVAERVRQVGPGKAGARGSHTIYRIAEAG